MCGMMGGGGGSSAADREAEQERQNSINYGMQRIDQTFAPFNDQYFADFEKKNLDLATPDIAQQKKEATSQTLYGLARSGNLDSSTAAKQYGDIERRNTQAIQQASDTAHSAAEGLRGDVEAERSNLAGQLNASADANAAASNAQTQAQLLTRTPTYSPITNIFSDLTSQIAANEQARLYGKEGWGFGLNPVSKPNPGPSVSEQRSW